MKAEPAVIVKNLYKSFKLPHEQHNGIKQLIVNFAKRKKGFETQHVLDDVSLEIKKGEFFGIVGRNGSGKSTLLKLLAGIYAPDEGLVKVNGTLTPFIELGVGFNPELTGRENVYMNGALLGFGRDEMDEMYEDIVKFAELKRFMDQKLKNYSSGMQVRLAFSIAIRAKSDILLLDEVLAVGDAAFQRKCYDYFKDLKNQGTTVIFISHDMNAMQEFCDRAAYINKGKIEYIGDTFSVAKKYNLDNFANVGVKKESQPSRVNGEPASIEEFFICDASGKIANSISAEDKDIYFDYVLKSSIDIDKPVVGIVVNNSDNKPVVAFNSKDIGMQIPDIRSGQSLPIRIRIQNIFNDGNYRIEANIRTNDRKTVYNMQNNLAEFSVSGRKNVYGMAHPDIEPVRK